MPKCELGIGRMSRREGGAMDSYNLVCVVSGLFIIAGFSALAARAQQALWGKCHRRESCLRTQQLITLGKSHCR